MYSCKASCSSWLCVCMCVCVHVSWVWVWRCAVSVNREDGEMPHYYAKLITRTYSPHLILLEDMQWRINDMHARITHSHTHSLTPPPPPPPPPPPHTHTHTGVQLTRSLQTISGGKIHQQSVGLEYCESFREIKQQLHFVHTN